MQISHDYAMRLLGEDSIQPPALKEEVDDAIFKSVISTSGGHQRFVDVSRCYLIHAQSFSLFGMCQSIEYLDVSFTQIDVEGLSVIASNCCVLKSIQLAGTNLENYDPLSKLSQLQLVNLRASSIQQLEPLFNLLLLRSLDLGYTNITSLDPITGLTRLEELALDSCVGISNQAAKDAIFSLKGLKFVNVGGHDLPPDFEADIIAGAQVDLIISTQSLR